VQLVVGRIGRAHGLRGEVTVEIRTDDPERRFGPGATVLTDPPERGPLTVASGKMHSGRLLLAFEGVRDRTGAEALRDTLLIAEVDPDEVPEDPEEFFDHQLLGLSVVTVGGVVVGVVEEMPHLPGQDVIAVRRPDGSEVLVPFVTELVPEIDVPGKRIVVDPPPGLLDDDSTDEA
jgi:16S rRNA processing protein RimM